MTKRDAPITCNIHMKGGTVFKLTLTELPCAPRGHPAEVGPHLPLADDQEATNTLYAVDWGEVAAITYRISGTGGRPAETHDRDVLVAIERAGGEVSSKRELVALLDVSHSVLDRILPRLEGAGLVEAFDGPRRATGYRLIDRDAPFRLGDAVTASEVGARSET